MSSPCAFFPHAGSNTKGQTDGQFAAALFASSCAGSARDRGIKMAVRRNFVMKRVCAKMVMVGCMKNDCRIKTEYRCLMVVGVVLGAGVLIYISALDVL